MPPHRLHHIPRHLNPQIRQRPNQHINNPPPNLLLQPDPPLIHPSRHRSRYSSGSSPYARYAAAIAWYPQVCPSTCRSATTSRGLSSALPPALDGDSFQPTAIAVRAT